MTMYLLTTPCVCDEGHQIMGLFSTKEKAEEAKAEYQALNERCGITDYYYILDLDVDDLY